MLKEFVCNSSAKPALATLFTLSNKLDTNAFDKERLIITLMHLLHKFRQVNEYNTFRDQHLNIS
jgi:hypothetical protein